MVDIGIDIKAGPDNQTKIAASIHSCMVHLEMTLRLPEEEKGSMVSRIDFRKVQEYTAVQ